MEPQTTDFDPRLTHLGGTSSGCLLQFSYLQKSDRSSYPSAGDCLTTSRYVDLIANHSAHNRYLTIATTDRRGDEVFVQDCVASLHFIKDSQAHASRAQREYPHCSPFVAAVQHAWHARTLHTHLDKVTYVNINKLSDFERLMSMQDTLLPDTLHARPSLVEYMHTPGSRSHQRPLQP